MDFSVSFKWQQFGFTLHFPAFLVGKGGILGSISVGIFAGIFISVYRVIFWVLWETINCSKLGYFMGVLAELCGFLGGWKRIF